MVDICWEGHSQRSAPQKRHMAHLRRCSCCTPRKLSSWDGGGDKSQPSTGGNCARQAPGHLSCSDLGWAQNAGPTKSAPLWSTRKPEPEQLLDLGSAWNPGSTSESSWQSNLEPELCRLRKHTRCQRRQTQCGCITVSTCQWYLFAVFLPPYSTTKQVSLKKVTTTSPVVSGPKLDTEETSKQKKLK